MADTHASRKQGWSATSTRSNLGERRRCEVVQWPARGAACSRCTGELYHAEKYTRDLAAEAPAMNRRCLWNKMYLPSGGVPPMSAKVVPSHFLATSPLTIQSVSFAVAKSHLAVVE